MISGNQHHSGSNVTYRRAADVVLVTDRRTKQLCETPQWLANQLRLNRAGYSLYIDAAMARAARIGRSKHDGRPSIRYTNPPLSPNLFLDVARCGYEIPAKAGQNR